MIEIDLHLPGRDAEGHFRNWVAICPERDRVETQYVYGHGDSIMRMNGREFRLVDIPQEVADLAPLRDYLRSHEALATIMEGYSTDMDEGRRNLVGRLTATAETALELLREELQEIVRDLPTYWTAEEWFGGVTLAEILETVERHSSVANAVAAIETQGLPDHHLDPDDLQQYLRGALRDIVEAEDEEHPDKNMAQRARRLLHPDRGEIDPGTKQKILAKWPHLASVHGDRHIARAALLADLSFLSAVEVLELSRVERGRP